MNTLGKLRPILDGELELMREWRNTPSIRANMFTRHEISSEEHQVWWEQTRHSGDKQYLMYEKSDVPSGIVCFTAIDRKNSNCFWAFYADPVAARGAGVKMEILALDYVFQTLKLHKLYCEVLAFNKPVIKLHQKFGFQLEGVFREQHKYDDAFIDVYRLGLFAREWETKREELVKRLSARIEI